MVNKNILYLLLLAPIFSFIQAHEKTCHLSGWYPRNKNSLIKKLGSLNQQAQKKYKAHVAQESIRALIAPHAGLGYSGTIAASVYRLADKNVNRIIILAPNHKTGSQKISIPSFTKYIMPNGALSLDTKNIEELSNNEHFSYQDNVFDIEHSLEMQLPFIAHYLPKAKIIPLIIGHINCQQAQEIALCLRKYINNTTLVVVSSDFTHYGKRFNFHPFSEHQDLHVRALDSQAIELLETNSCKKFETFMNNTKPTICGANPLKVLLALKGTHALGNIESRLVGYDTSSDPRKNDSVSYVGMVFTTEKLTDKPIEHQLTQQEQRNLISQARETLKHMFDENFEESLYYPINSLGVRQKLGAFTTINTEQNKLRGCIGHITTNKPIYQTIARITKSAALHDSRFKPVTKEEISSLKLKLSILSQPKKIERYQNIILGKHGIILNKGSNRAVFLPEVPTNFGWTLDHTLMRLSKKAGLPGNSWHDTDTQFQVFESLDIK